MFNSKKIFLTGGNGFIGRNILEQIGDKYELLSPTQVELNLLDSESVYDYIKQNKPNIVLHAASVGGKRNQTGVTNVVEDNLKMFFNLIRSKKNFNHMIVLGSGAEYDKTRSIKNIEEKNFGEFVPKDQYGFSKYVMAKYAEKVDFITHLRLFGVFGKYEDYETRFISNAICRKIFGLPLIINQNVFFDYIYIKDLIKILEFFIENRPKEKFYNIGTGKPTDLLSLAKTVNNTDEKKQEIKIIYKELNNEYSCNTTRLKEFIGSYDFFTYQDAIKEMLEYYKNRKGEIDKKNLLKDI